MTQVSKKIKNKIDKTIEFVIKIILDDLKEDGVSEDMLTEFYVKYTKIKKTKK